MPCSTVKTAIGTAIVCSGRRPVAKCSHPGCTTRHSRLCDYPTPTGSCDKPLCVEHSRQVARGVDHCIDHPEVQGTLALRAPERPLPQSGAPNRRRVQSLTDRRIS